MWWSKKEPAPRAESVAVELELEREPMKINAMLLAQASTKPETPVEAQFVRYVPPSGVIPEDKQAATLAMDSTPYQYLNAVNAGVEAFPGYPRLAQLALRPEYRKMVSTIAEEMTRKWMTLRAVGDDDKSERIDAIDAELRRLNVREVFRQADENDGYYGRGQVYIEMKAPDGTTASDNPAELDTMLFMNRNKVVIGSLVALRSIEPVWTYPKTYNADNPLSATFYKPDGWYVMAKSVHSSRVLTFISRPVPDLFKAAYNFGGLSLTQIAEPYVNNWLRTRDSVGDMVHSFSISGLAVDMSAALAGDGGTSLFDRAELFNRMRDNRGVMMTDKANEEFFQFNTPLSGLDALQAQAQEQQASICGIPLVKLLGITPTGLNASTDGEIRVFYDGIHARQENLFRAPLKTVIDLVQLSLFGDIDPDIDFKFEPLYQLSELDQANVHKIEADTDAVLINASVITTDESRERLASDPDSPYQSLDLNDPLLNDLDDLDDDDQAEDPAADPTERGRQGLVPQTA